MVIAKCSGCSWNTTTAATGAYNKATYNGKTLVRWQDDYARVSILDATKATPLAFITNSTGKYPYVTRSGNNTFVDVNSLITAADAIAPAIDASWPAGTIHSSDNVISIRYHDPEPGSGINTAAVRVDLDGQPVTGCLVASDLVSCPVSGMVVGEHTVGGFIADNAGNTTPVSFGFSVQL
ncbi:MAG: hypothetical protein ACYCXF_05455 [Thermoleophilia bacterium]